MLSRKKPSRGSSCSSVRQRATGPSSCPRVSYEKGMGGERVGGRSMEKIVVFFLRKTKGERAKYPSPAREGRWPCRTPGLGGGRARPRPRPGAVEAGPGPRRFSARRAQNPAPASAGPCETAPLIGRLPGPAAATVKAIGRAPLPCAARCGKCPRYRQWLPGPRRSGGGRARAPRPPERGRRRLLADSISLSPAGC